MENPFKFGTIVEGDYFTDRVEEVAYIRQFIESPNHLVLISPRRYGKSSVVHRALLQSGRKHITLNLQQVTSVTDLAGKLLREVYRLHPMERLRQYVMHFRFIPTLSVNPVTGSTDVSFQPGQEGQAALEDVMDLLDRLSEKDRLVVVLDEFQEILQIRKGLDRQLRAIMQTQQHINYILLGSQESMMTEIFERKKSPFYHFGELMRLRKLPYEDFRAYLSERFAGCLPDVHDEMAEQILNFTSCHPYYTQQLASVIWQRQMLHQSGEDLLLDAVREITATHGLDYERLWQNLTQINRRILHKLVLDRPLQNGEDPTSTIYSALKKMQKDGYLTYSTHYEIEDPFFREWIKEKLK